MVESSEKIRCPECGHVTDYNGMRSRKAIQETHILERVHDFCRSCGYEGDDFVVIDLEVFEVAGRPHVDVEHYLETGELVEVGK